MYLADDDRILDADEIAAELVPDAGYNHSFSAQPLPSGAPMPPRSSASHGNRERDFFEQVFAARSGTQPANTVRPRQTMPQPLAAGAHSTVSAMSSELQNARLELARLHSQMRARDAYLVELEQALNVATRQLAASGIGTLDDAYRLLGRVRGQAFRIAELESELRTSKQAQAQSQPQAAPLDEKPTLKPPKPRAKLPAARAVVSTTVPSTRGINRPVP
jgi:hypothetical protein